jgi:cytochrome b561
MPPQSSRILFYALLIGIPLTGWLAFGDSCARSPRWPRSGSWRILACPPLLMSGEAAKEVHEIGSKIHDRLVALHVLAALKHQFVDRDGIFRRMLPH